MIRTAPGAAAVGLAAALAIGTAGLARGTWAVGGSDSACYALMAEAFARGRLQPTSSLADVPWPEPSLTLAPAGFIPSPSRPGAASPICAPGFSLFLAPLVMLGGRDALFLLTPLAGAALVWMAFLLGRRLAGQAAGATAAVLVASTPILLFQVVQPMNDVFVSALWIGAVMVLAGNHGFWLGGVLVGAALLTRPNLLPAGLVVAGWVFASGRAGDLTSPWKGGITALAKFGLAVLPFGLGVLALNQALYGGAFRSGYGDATGMFAWSNIAVNAASHLKAVFETQLGLPLLGLAAPFVIRDARRPAALATLVAVAVILCYQPYQPYPEWWYLRFLLPALVLLVTLAASLLARLAAGSRASPTRGFGLGASGATLAAPRLAAGGRVALVAAVVLLSVYQVRVARDRQAFDLQRLESRYRHVAEAMLDHLPPSTVAISVWDSGSVRFHAGREAVMWDALDPAWLDRAVTWLFGQGRPSVVVVERWEEPLFRARFGARSTIGGLDWPPRVDVDGLVRIYDPADRIRYLAGQRVETTIVAPRR